VRYKDAVMQVTRSTDKCPDSQPSATVEISNIPSNVKQDTLLMLFENTKRSGGGTVANIDYVMGSDRARVTFTDPAGMYLAVGCCTGLGQLSLPSLCSQ